MWYPLWGDDWSVVYNCCCPRQRSHSCGRVPRDSWPHFTVWDSRLTQPGGSGPCIYIPRNMVAQLYLQALGSFSSPPTTRRATVEIFDLASTWEW
jgi:hypothetical protein